MTDFSATMKRKDVLAIGILLLIVVQYVECIIPLLIKGGTTALRAVAKTAASSLKKKAAMKLKERMKQFAKEKAKEKKRELKENLKSELKAKTKQKTSMLLKGTSQKRAEGITSNAENLDALKNNTTPLENESESEISYKFKSSIEKEAFVDLYVLLKHCELFRNARKEILRLRVSSCFLHRFKENKRNFQQELFKYLMNDNIFEEMSFMLMYISVKLESANEIYQLIFVNRVPDSQYSNPPVPYLRRVLQIQSASLHEAFQFYLTQFYERDEITIAYILTTIQDCSFDELKVFFQNIYTKPFQKKFPRFLSKLKEISTVKRIPKELAVFDIAEDFLLDPIYRFNPYLSKMPVKDEV